MKPFDFIIVFFSFVFTLGLTHLLLAVSRMIRHRRALRFSWPHGLWMAVALANLGGNWLSFWDFRSFRELTIGTIASGFLVTMLCYLFCATVSPDFERGESLDMQVYHQTEGPTYIAIFLALVVTSLVVNLAAGEGPGVANWTQQNGLVLAMVPPTVLALFDRREWVQGLAALTVLAGNIAFSVIYYPVLTA